MEIKPGDKVEMKELRRLSREGELFVEPFWFPVTYLGTDQNGHRVVRLPNGQQQVLHREQELRPL